MEPTWFKVLNLLHYDFHVLIESKPMLKMNENHKLFHDMTYI
jgi:hypothetical protein